MIYYTRSGVFYHFGRDVEEITTSRMYLLETGDIVACYYNVKFVLSVDQDWCKVLVVYKSKEQRIISFLRQCSLCVLKCS